MKARSTPRRPTNFVSDTTRAYILIAVTLLGVFGLGLFAIESGAVDVLNASGLLGDRS
ncbi:MAG: hypothetical protein ACRED5_05065 [Propylenella sp.]